MFPYPICYGACELQTEITSDQMGVLQRYTELYSWICARDHFDCLLSSDCGFEY